MPARLAIFRVVALLAMPLLLACGYVLTQRWVRAEFVRAHEASIADARASLERREQERRTGMPERRPETAISGGSPR
jgi:hypothetical protein